MTRRVRCAPGSAETERSQHRPQFDLRLLELHRGIGALDDPRTGVEGRGRSIDLPAAKRIANSPSPSRSNHPTGPAYLPRSWPSSSRINSTAVLVGVPATAAVGCRAASRSATVVPGWTSPWKTVDRCWMSPKVATVRSDRWSLAQNGMSALSTESAASACSRVIFSVSNVPAEAGSPGSADPASEIDRTRPEASETRSSGLEPTNPSTRNV